MCISPEIWSSSCFFSKGKVNSFPKGCASLNNSLTGIVILPRKSSTTIFALNLKTSRNLSWVNLSLSQTYISISSIRLSLCRGIIWWNCHWGFKVFVSTSVLAITLSLDRLLVKQHPYLSNNAIRFLLYMQNSVGIWISVFITRESPLFSHDLNFFYFGICSYAAAKPVALIIDICSL